MKALIAQKNRSKAFGTAPAKGLILSKVHYQNLDKKLLKT